VRFAAVFYALFAVALNAQAQAWPAKPVRVIVPFAPGGTADTLGRLTAKKLSDAFHEGFVVENRPGAGGVLGSELVAKAPPDGYTVLAISSTLVVNPSLFARLGFDTMTDLAPVSLVGVSPQVLLVNPAVPATTLKELIDWVKASPGKYSYAHAGLGTPGYLAGEMLKQAFGLDLVAVSFNGGGPAITSTIGGHTPIVFTSIASAPGTSKPAACARSRCRRRSARRRCPMCRRSRRRARPARSPTSYSACWCPAELRPRSSSACTARWSRWSPRPRCASGSRRLASRRSPARRRNSPIVSSWKSRSGRR
jgi:tripartite-type tricarboxylate transporter receptor subunit TctC